jgi:hypothetical protein
VITAPTVIDVADEDYRATLMTFLAELRSVFTCTDNRPILIDFSGTERLNAGGTLLMHAEVFRLIQMTSPTGAIVRCKPAKKQKADHVLAQVGIYKMCGNNRRCKAPFGDVVHWRVAHGYKVDNSLCAPAVEEFEGRIATPLIDGIFRGLGEAMTNTIHHAYIQTRDDGLDYTPETKDWWMFSQKRDGYLSVLICDLGVGIPETLREKRPYLLETLARLGKSGSDGAAIEEAVKDARTRTKRAERGRGLGNIVNVVSKIPNGRVTIYSNRGLYSIRDGNLTVANYKQSILGTLVAWRIPLTGVAIDGD